jgi:hypothetical protein
MTQTYFSLTKPRMLYNNNNNNKKCVCNERNTDMVSKKYLIINIEKTVAMFFNSNQFRYPNKPRVILITL